MMNASDNMRTRTVTDNFGGFTQLNQRAGLLGMDATTVNHHIGCGLPANVTTLRDIAHLHQRVIDGYLGAQRETFYSFMRQDYATGGYAEGQLGIVMGEEASLAGVTTSQLNAFKDRSASASRRAATASTASTTAAGAATCAFPSTSVASSSNVSTRLARSSPTPATRPTPSPPPSSPPPRCCATNCAPRWSRGTTLALASVTTIGSGCGSPTTTQTYSACRAWALRRDTCWRTATRTRWRCS